jgi:hypothetical protein
MDGMNEKLAKISGSRPLPSIFFSHFFILPFDTSLSEQMNRENSRLIIQEAKAHPEL